MARTAGVEMHVNAGERLDRVIYLGVPTLGRVSIRWHAHMMQLQSPLNRSVFHAYGQGWEVGQARNYLVQQALDWRNNAGHTVSHVFFIDDDVLIPPYALTNLLARNRPIVSGLYYAKTPAPQPLLLMDRMGGTGEDVIQAAEKNALIECYGHGMGCTLIELRVFRELQAAGLAPDETQPTGQVLPQWFKTTRDALSLDQGAPILSQQTEDLYFLENAARLGYPAAVDLGVFGFHWDDGTRQGYPAHLWDEYQRTGNITLQRPRTPQPV